MQETYILKPMGFDANLREVKKRVEQAARSCGRDPSSIHLLAVSKTFGAERIEEAWRCGQRSFGENRVQEAEQKRPACPDGIEWHLIGPLQSNKARRAVELFDVIQTLDRPRIVRRVGEISGELGKNLGVYLQVNIGEEEQKHGAAGEEVLELVEGVDEYPNLHLQGLMCIPPYNSDPEETRPYFRALRQLLSDLNGQRDEPLKSLSMGMSHDFEVAIEEGSTLVRIGTALFGSRTGSGW